MDYQELKMTNEEILIGQILVDNKIWYSIQVKADHFGNPRCRRAYKVLQAMFDKGIHPDLLSVTEEDKDLSVSWWSELSDIPSSANWKYYHDIIIEDYRHREIGKLARSLTDWHTENLTTTEILELLDKRIFEITELTGEDRIYKLSELLPDLMNKLEERFKAKGELPGISTGIPGLNNLTLGLQKKLKYQIGGRPSDGKSALMVTLAVNIGIVQKIPVGIISLESSKQELATRILGNVGSLDTRDLMTGMISHASFNSIDTASGKLDAGPIWIYDVPNLSLSELKVQARRMVRQHKVQVLFIDYEQLIEIPGVHKKLDRATEVSIAIKNLARELEIPIVSLAQLRRDAENRRPTLADFSDTSQLEKDADCAILIYHDKDDDGNIIDSYLCVEKMRDGQTGNIRVHFDKKHVRFTEQNNNQRRVR